MRSAGAFIRLSAATLGAAFGTFVAPTAMSAQIEIRSSDFGGLSARAIGPAVMSGRVAALDAFPEDPLTIYVGAASGGVWKSRDGGTTFEPVFDDHPQSIGAIAIDPSDVNTVWVGTGESWVRNSTSIGRGVYRTTNGGESWDLLGLEDTERIATIRVDPTDGDRVFVCAVGHLWDGGEERGVFRTTDGGESWEKVLYVDDTTGCSSLDMDLHAPSILYAGMWQVRRWPYFFESGGPGSGLYRSTDGGSTWQEMTDGLPESDLGRIGIAVARSQSNFVYAVVEADSTALYRSEDLGTSWEKVNESQNVTQRPFYFALLGVDPTDHLRVYKPGFTFTTSEDGGESFNSQITGGFGQPLHSDHHAIWINPTRPTEIWLGTDGGVYTSRDAGTTWRHIKSLPLSQFYEVSYDMDWPYNVYGGLQDNGTWTGPSRQTGGIRNRDWRNIASGDGFHAFVDPDDDEYIYVESQGGNVLRYYRSTGESKQIRPYEEGEEEDLRFNWNTPIHIGAASGALYIGSQYLHRSRDRGDSWERISSDLTTDDPEKQRQEESGGLTTDATTAENHTTIYSISESPLDETAIWAGTDDGNLQLTRDGGATWAELSDATGVPEATWVSHVEASSHAAGTAFVTFDGHRDGDMATYLFRTDDYGASWTSLVTDQMDGYAHVIKQDPVNPELLFLGTELGLFITLDGGQNWARYSADAGGLPPVSVRDLQIHQREHDLVIATHGRGIYILDDLTPLRNLTAAVLASDAALLPSRPAAMVAASSLQEFPGWDEYIGPNPSEAASIVFYQQKRHLFGDLFVEVYDQHGELVTTLPGGKRRGINRVDWAMRLPPPKLPAANSLVSAFQGPRALEGDYTVRLVKGDSTYEGTVALGADPRSPHSAEDRRLGQQTAMALYEMLADLTYMVEAATELRDQAREMAEAEGVEDRVARRLTELADAAEAYRVSLVSTAETETTAGEERLREDLGNLFGSVAGFDGRPSESQLGRKEALEDRMAAEAVAPFGSLTGETLGTLNSYLQEQGLDALELVSREAWEADQGGS